MELNLVITFLKDNSLTIVVLVLTLIFIYHYIIEKEHGVKLTKKYRESIYEAQSKIFLNATQYLISGNKDLAIKEFLNAVDLNRETLDTYFALGGLFRSNGEIDKAISIHRSLIARDSISETAKLKALKELALDFDKGGFINKAIETYKDVLRINRDQHEVIQSLCRIYEDVGDWDNAYNYRVMLSKVGHENQSETISHILVEKSKRHFENQEFAECTDDLDDAFRFAPSVSAKILKLKLYMIQKNRDDARALMLELVKEHPLYTSFIFVSLETDPMRDKNDDYKVILDELKEFFLEFEETDVMSSPSLVLSQVRLLKQHDKTNEAFRILDNWMNKNSNQGDILKVEYVKLLIETNQVDKALDQTKELLTTIHGSLTRHFCSECGYNSDDIFWRCPQCHKWETIQFRWKV